MAVAFVKQSAEAYGLEVSSFAPSLASVVAGNCCVVTISYVPSGTSDVAVPTPTTGWSVATAPTTGDGNAYDAHAAIFYKQNAGSGTQTATFSLPAGSYIGGQISEYSGVSTTAALDVAAFNDATGSTGGSVTTATSTVADAVVVANVCVIAENPSTPPTTSYTAIGQDPGDNITYSSAYKILSATGTQSATWTWSGAGYTFHYIAVAAVFKADSGGGVDDADATPAAGTSTVSTVVGSSTAATTASAAAGVSTTSTVVGSSTAVTTASAAAGTSTTSTVVGASVKIADVSPAAGSSTVSTLTASSTAATTADNINGTCIVAAIGSSTATSDCSAAAGASSTSASGSSLATADPVAANGTSTVSTVVGDTLTGSNITPAAGTSTVSTVVGSSVAASTANASAGSASVASVGSSLATTAATPAAGLSTVSTVVGSDASAPPPTGSTTFRPQFRPRRR